MIKYFRDNIFVILTLIGTACLTLSVLLNVYFYNGWQDEKVFNISTHELRNYISTHELRNYTATTARQDTIMANQQIIKEMVDSTLENQEKILDNQKKLLKK